MYLELNYHITSLCKEISDITEGVHLSLHVNVHNFYRQFCVNKYERLQSNEMETFLLKITDSEVISGVIKMLQNRSRRYIKAINSTLF